MSINDSVRGRITLELASEEDYVDGRMSLVGDV